MAPLKFAAAEFVTVTAVSPVELDTPPAPKIPATVKIPVPALNVNVSPVPPDVPLIAPTTVIAPAPDEPCVDKVTFAPSAIVKAPLMLNGVLVVVILLPKLTAPVNVVKPPGAMITPPELRVNTPVFVIAIEDPDFTVTGPSKVTVVPNIVKVPIGVVFPTPVVLLNKTGPPVPVKVNACAPLIEPAILIPTVPAEVLILEAPVVRTTVPPLPDCVKPPGAVIAIPAKVRAPVLCIAIGPLAVVVTVFANVKLVPVKLIPATADVVTVPKNEVVPVPMD